MLEIILFLSLAAIVYVYLGYPLIIWFIGAIRPKPVRKSEYYPFVSIVTAAHNEIAVIKEMIANKLNLDYPKEMLEIIVVSDASTDGTDEAVKEISDSHIHLMRQEPRQGKTAALNRAVSRARGEIIVFSDANSMYHLSALKELAFNFADSSVGYVTGKMEYLVSEGSHVGAGSRSYMRYENWLRELETAVGSVVGVDGGIDAVRKSLYVPMDPSVLPDFVLPLNVTERGYRVIYEPRAISNEEALSRPEDEHHMRVRVGVRAFRAMWQKKALFNPFRFGLYSLQLFSHKLLRYLVGFFMIIILVSSLAIQEPWSNALLDLQGIAYCLALIGFYDRRIRALGIIRYPFYFCLLNFASVIALIRFLLGEKATVWTPRKG
jgi:cellulose synthase/poly-beta-1,6-N-acetylglucosamine synthase-like glycosyltransferase